MRRIVAMGLMVMAGAAQAQADFCADVRDIAAAALETPAFASIPRLPQQRPMLGHRVCFVMQGPGGGFIRWFDQGARFVCDHPGDFPHDRGWTNPDELMSRIAGCLPRALRSGQEYRDSAGASLGAQLPPERQWRYNTYRSLYVDAGPLRFEYTTFSHPRFDRSWLTAYLRDAGSR